MNRHLVYLANAYYGFAALLGLPSLAGAVFFGFAVIRLAMLAPVQTPAPSPSAEPVSLVSLLEGGARVFGSVIGVLGGLASVSTRDRQSGRSGLLL